MVTIDETNYLEHYGVLRRSGRYPWGSAGNENQRNKIFLDYVNELRAEGLSEAEIAKGLNTSTTQLRAAKTIALSEQKQSKINQAQRLKDEGWSNVAIGERMGIPESSVRALLKPGSADKAKVLNETANMLRAQVDEKGIIDIGRGVETQIGISDTKLKASVALLVEEGYEVQYVNVPQAGTGLDTSTKVLVPPGQSYSDTYANRDNIQQISGTFTDDGGRSYYGLREPISINPDRVGVRYAEDGGTDADGVIYVRPGVKDISLDGSNYAQVRIKVGEDSYLKGMAVYKDDLPEGVDLLFNTNKSDTGNKLDAMKKLTDDENNPFGSAFKRQVIERDTDGNEIVTSAMNIVNEEGDWNRWSNNLSTQMLSKQSPKLVKQQLDLTYERRQNDYEDIMALTNPTVKRKLLEEFADGTDSAAVHLKAAALPRQASKVILPIQDMSDGEIYAPSFRDGESVVLIRYPHGGTFEIPELTVNNKHPSAKKILGNKTPDAVGINAKVAERLSGADFDGDTVLVIPNDKRQVQTSKALEGLKDFDPIRAYPAYDGMKPMSNRIKQQEMGYASNLITDMTIRGASPNELARAVRYSMVVIDGEKHNLDYKQAAIDNGIKGLKERYQGSPRGGASTVVSNSGKGAKISIPDRIPRRYRDGGPIDPKTGKKVFQETGESYVNKDGKLIVKTKRVPKLEVNDAEIYSSGTPIERLYVDHSNRMKDLGNKARKSMVETPRLKQNPSAKKVYKDEVDSLNSKLAIAKANAPLERQAQILTNKVFRAQLDANPSMTEETKRKIKGQTLEEMRARTGAKKQRIQFTPKEWEAIQAGAISESKLSQILDNADMDSVRAIATPRTQVLMTSTKTKRANSMLASGYTRAEVADALGVSLTTLDTATVGDE